MCAKQVRVVMTKFKRWYILEIRLYRECYILTLAYHDGDCLLKATIRCTRITSAGPGGGKSGSYFSYIEETKLIVFLHYILLRYLHMKSGSYFCRTIYSICTVYLYKYVQFVKLKAGCSCTIRTDYNHVNHKKRYNLNY